MNLKKLLCMLISIHLILSYGMRGTLALAAEKANLYSEDSSSENVVENVVVFPGNEASEDSEDSNENTEENRTEDDKLEFEDDQSNSKTDSDSDESSSEENDSSTNNNACNCGEGAPENLAKHADSCPRKQYIKGIVSNESGGYKTAEEIYTSWQSYDADTQTDVLNMLQAYVPTTYDELTKLINPDSKEDPGITLNGVTIFGVPENVTPSINSIIDIPLEVQQKIGQHKLAFSLDITLKDKENNWQPEAGEKVTVELDSNQFNLANGEKIAILHEHDGKIEDLGEYTITNGKLTFETDSFSNFYGYTVDFKYNGIPYSIAGGSDIYLYELFPMLGINRSDSEVQSVEFKLIEKSEQTSGGESSGEQDSGEKTNAEESSEEKPSVSDLLSASRVVSNGYTGETAWLIQSLRPFKESVEMKITFTDNSSITVEVNDKTYDSFISGDTYTLEDEDVINSVSIGYGQTVTINLTGGTVTVNGRITINGGTLTIEGSGTLQRGSGFTGRMFDVYGNGKLIIRGSESSNIVIDGGAEWVTTEVTGQPTRKSLSVTSGNDTTSAAIYVGHPVGYDTDTGKYEGFPTVGRVHLSNVTMQKLYSSKQAPAIHVTGDANRANETYSTVTMNNVTVQKCATIGDNAITMFNDCVANLNNCTYENNYSGNRYAGTIKAGGPNYFSQLYMENCTAEGNYSSGWGGVVLWAANESLGSDMSSKAIIDGCTFDGNTARWLGGAISNEAIMEVKNTTIINNSAMAGGGIANFPFTLTETSASGHNACGLTLSGENQISNNIAHASEKIKPFSSGEYDTETIPSATEYTGGGGGIWCFMNKEGWECSLEIVAGNKIFKNESKNFGGGVYIDKVAGDTTILSINGADIYENTAVNGGGIAVNQANITVSSGEIKSNTANNGGGVYVKNGSITVSGGLIRNNKAEGTYNGNTTKVDSSSLKGVGGGIFLETGSSLTINTDKQIGIYSNTADVAANDVYACGENTKLNLPDVKNMNLLGYTEEVKPTGWYADYMSGDENYPIGVIEKENPGRYDSASSKNVAIDTESIINENSSAFYCLTLGYNHPGYGSLTIEKTGIKLSDHDGSEGLKQSSLFLVKGKSNKMGDISLHVTIVGNGSVTIDHLPDGKYTVTELTNWTWRYTLKSGYPKCYPEGKETSTTEETITIGAEEPNWKADFVNERTNAFWLSGDNYCENKWKEEEEKTSEPDDQNEKE